LNPAQILKLLCLLSLSFSLLEFVLGAINAPIFTPSWEYFIVLGLAVWITWTPDRLQRLFGFLFLLDLASGGVVSYALRISRLRPLHFGFALCWLLLSVFYLKKPGINHRHAIEALLKYGKTPA
jgi:hypothetical protein